VSKLSAVGIALFFALLVCALLALCHCGAHQDTVCLIDRRTGFEKCCAESDSVCQNTLVPLDDGGVHD